MPNTEGVFLMTFLNTSDKEYILSSRKVVGSLQQPGETLIPQGTRESETKTKVIPIGVNLSDDERH